MESRTSQIEDDKTQHAGFGLAWKRRVLVFWSSSSSMLSVADKMDDVPSAIAHGEATAMTMAPFLALQTAAWERCGPGDCGLGDPTMWDAQSLKQTPGLGSFHSQDAGRSRCPTRVCCAASAFPSAHPDSSTEPAPPCRLQPADGAMTRVGKRGKGEPEAMPCQIGGTFAARDWVVSPSTVRSLWAPKKRVGETRASPVAPALPFQISIWPR